MTLGLINSVFQRGVVELELAGLGHIEFTVKDHNSVPPGGANTFDIRCI